MLMVRLVLGPSLMAISIMGILLILENKKIFELKNEGYRVGIKRKETR